jgi:hypothetical protein
MQFWPAIKHPGFQAYRSKTGHIIQPIEYMKYPEGWIETSHSGEKKPAEQKS